MSPHTKTLEAVMQDLTTSREGLSAVEARKRLAVYGRNELVEKKKKAPWRMFLDQFTDFMIIVLITAAVIAGVVGKPTDAIAILTIVVLNAIIGFIQEYRAEEAMAALKRMAAPSATAIRDGQPVTVPAGELVPGDVVLLEAGQVIPADMRLCECANLRVEEAALTGESEPVEKRLIDMDNADLSLGDRKNMVYQGTIATYGRGAGIVTATGMTTEMGKIAALLQSGEEVKTPLHQRLTVFGKRLALAILVICAIVFVAGCLRGEPVLFMLLTAISLAVAAIPEALPAVITIALALGAKKMVKLQALIRKLPAVETLGSVTYICSDKTGTLTQNRMTVETLYTNGTLIDMTSETAEPRRGEGCMAPHLSLLFTALAITNDARCNDSGETVGDRTVVALHCIAEACGYNKVDLEARHPRTGEIPFDSDRKCMTTIHALQDPETFSLPTLTGQGSAYRYISFTKGALDALLEKADLMMSAAGPVPVDRNELQAVHSRMAAEGLRVLAVAARFWEEIPEHPSPETVETHLVLLGLVGMMDPPRAEAMEAVAQCKNAGIVPVMITGDHA